MDVKAIKVVIGTKVVDGRRQAAYPDFNELQIVKDSGMDWAYYVDANGGGWHYDKCCAHAVEAPGSPVGNQFGMLLVPPAFAAEAVARFGGIVTEIGSEADVEAFYDQHAHGHEAEENVNERVVNAINLKVAVNGSDSLNDTDKKAIDPDDPTPGINRNPNKHWADHKASRGFNLV